jgi:hypothetical protein
LELYRLVSQVTALIHLFEVDQLVGIDVELEDLLVETLRPTSPQNIDKSAFGNSCSV